MNFGTVLTRLRINYLDFLFALPSPLSLIVKKITSFLQIKFWEKNGRPSPPPHPIKVKNILNVAEKNNLKVLVETGTYLGEMVFLTKDYFDRIYSIELDKKLARRAKRIFKNDKHVKVIQGDSGLRLKELVTKLDRPALFWLDAHYSGGVTAKGKLETPIIKELKIILRQKKQRHIILIDDAREFVGVKDYPKLSVVKELVKKMRPKARISVKDDSIKIE